MSERIFRIIHLCSSYWARQLMKNTKGQEEGKERLAYFTASAKTVCEGDV